MALYWYWYNVMGELEFSNGGYKWKRRIYKGHNCMAVLAQLDKANTVGNPLNKPVWTVYGEFWNDPKHLRNMLGLQSTNKLGHENYYLDAVKLRFNTYFLDDETKNIITLFAKAFKANATKRKFNIELYYKVPKKPKEKKNGTN